MIKHAVRPLSSSFTVCISLCSFYSFVVGFYLYVYLLLSRAISLVSVLVRIYAEHIKLLDPPDRMVDVETQEIVWSSTPSADGEKPMEVIPFSNRSMILCCYCGQILKIWQAISVGENNAH
jgi:hypothetical protein